MPRAALGARIVLPRKATQQRPLLGFPAAQAATGRDGTTPVQLGATYKNGSQDRPQYREPAPEPPLGRGRGNGQLHVAAASAGA